MQCAVVEVALFSTLAGRPSFLTARGTNVPIRGKRDVQLELEVTYHAGQKHLPIVTIKRAA